MGSLVAIPPTRPGTLEGPAFLSLAGLGNERMHPLPTSSLAAPHPQSQISVPRAGSGSRPRALAPPLPGERTMWEPAVAPIDTKSHC